MLATIIMEGGSFINAVLEALALVLYLSLLFSFWTNHLHHHSTSFILREPELVALMLQDHYPWIKHWNFQERLESYQQLPEPSESLLLWNWGYKRSLVWILLAWLIHSCKFTCNVILIFLEAVFLHLGVRAFLVLLLLFSLSWWERGCFRGLLGFQSCKRCPCRPVSFFESLD